MRYAQMRTARDLLDADVAPGFIRVHLGALGDIRGDVAFQHARERMQNDGSPRATVALYKHGNRRLAVPLGFAAVASAFTRLAADVGFVSLDDLALAA